MQLRRFKLIYFISVALLVLLLGLVLLMVSRRPVGNYSDPAGPIYKGNYAEIPAEFDGILKVVAWNMHYGEKLEQAIATLQDAEELSEADVLLLQEMNAIGVEQLAQALHYNYVFYPAAMHRQRREEYGNAILSKWPIRNSAKIVLPNWLPGWLQSRNAARAVLNVGEKDIPVYSVHLDTTWMIPWWGLSQGAFLAEQAGTGQDLIVVGGDFNTWTPGSIVGLESSLQSAGMERLTRGTGYTFKYFGIELTLDHIFGTQGFDYRAGVYRQTDASDHYPLWAEITIPTQE
jgi:endonuclease/exonuclease/phosphatase family metal-dependent hydrolase